MRFFFRRQSFGLDVAVVADVFEADGDLLRHARFLHRHAVDRVRAGHRLFRVRDDDELRPGQKIFQHFDEAVDVGLVQGGVDFVEHAERAGPAAEDGQQHGHAGERLFAAAKKRNAARFLAGRPGDDLDAAVENIHAFFQHDVGLAAAEQIAEKLLKMPADRVQRFGEQPPAVGVDLVDDLFQRRLGVGQIVVLVGKRFVAGFQLFEFFQGLEVDVAEVVDLPPQIVDLLLHFLALVLFFGVGIVLQFGQFDAVILAQPVGQGRAFVADFVGRQILGVDFILELADFGADFLDLGRQFRSLRREAPRAG